MAGTRRPPRAPAKKVKYNEVEDDIELPDFMDGQNDSVPHEVINLITDDEEDDDQRMPNSSVSASAVLAPIVQRKRKRYPPKKPVKAEPEEDVIVIVDSEEEDNRLRGPGLPAAKKLKLNFSQNKVTSAAQGSMLPSQPAPRKILKAKGKLANTAVTSLPQSFVAPPSLAQKVPATKKAAKTPKPTPKPRQTPVPRKSAAKTQEAPPKSGKPAPKKANLAEKADSHVEMADAEESAEEGEDSNDSDSSDTPEGKKKFNNIKKDPYKYAEGIAQGTEHIADAQQMIEALIRKLLELMMDDDNGLVEEILHLKVATACSGTDMPILVLEIAAKYLHQLKTHNKESFDLIVEHVFSAEIEPYKQAYIQRNFNPPLLFRDVTEFAQKADEDNVHWATTAFGSRKPVPAGLDILITGFCCVDFSMMNICRKTLDQMAESGDSLHGNLSYARTHKPKIIILENVITAPWKDASFTAQARQKALSSLVNVAVAKLQEERKNSGEPITVSKETRAKIKKCQSKILNEVDDETLNRGIDWHLEKIGYLSLYIKVDTKEYRIPQTRQRGYLVAINIEKYGETMPGATTEQVKVAIKQCLSKWQDLMQQLKSPASVPVEAMFVATHDDNQPMQSRAEELNSENTKTPLWSACKPKHIYYRDLNNYGHGRTLLSWSENGFRKLPEHWQFMKGLTDRVADANEIAHLRCIARGMDDRYYSRHLDLSQNVFRVHDHTKNGLIGCVTPKGIPFWTYKGRRMSGREALVVQGLPVNMLDLSQLSDAYLQDFSGNAMTSTVVAAAMFSAMIAFRSFLTFTRRDSNLMELDQPNVSFDSVDGLVENHVDPTIVIKKLSVEAAKSKAAQCVSLCHCEGRHDKLDKVFLRCTVCKYTGCLECAGNPAHSFEPISQGETEQRTFPSSFQEVLEKALPTMIRFTQLGDIIKSISKRHPKAGAVSWGCLEKYYMAAVSSNLFLKRISRREIWEIVFASPEAKLVLTINANQVQWLLYAVPKPHLSLTDPIRRYLEANPIARLHPVGDDITRGYWKVFVPHYQLVDATITSSGNLNPSYESWIGLEDHKNQFVFDHVFVAIQSSDAQLLETDIAGDYAAHPQCGQAFSSAHVKCSTLGDRMPLYFFLDHIQQRGDPWRHQFVLTHDPRRQQPLEDRILIAQLAPDSPFPMATQNSPEVPRNQSWRQPKVKMELTNGGETCYQFRASSASSSRFQDVVGSINEFEIIDRVKILVPGSWIKSGLSLQSRDNSLSDMTICYQHIPSQISAVNAFLGNTTCEESKTVFLCEARIPDYISSNYPLAEIITLDHTNQVQVTRDLLWMLQSSLPLSGYTLASGKWYTFSLPTTAIRRDGCRCAPSRPQLLWAFNKRIPQSKKQTLYEDPEQAAAYERSLKSRAKAIDFQFFIRNGNVTVQVAVNFMTLVHRAIFDLAPSGSTGGIEAKTSLITDDRFTPLKPFTPFTFPSSRKMKKNPGADDPDEFKEYQLSGSIQLRHEQCRSVAWQVSQELTRPEFSQEIVVEEQSRFGYRASAKVSRPARIGGGLLFHPVGFGKTAVVLGLISNQKENDEAWAQEARKNSTGSIPLKATVIFMSNQLTGQWKEEVSKFLGPQTKNSILVIKGIADFTKLTVNDFQQAWIVIVNWNLLANDAYLDSFAQFAGMVGMDPQPIPSPRVYSMFHEAAMAGIERNVDILRSNPSGFQSLVDEQINRNIKVIAENKAPIPSKRVTGSAYQSAASRTQNPEQAEDNEEINYTFTTKGPELGKSWDSAQMVPLEAFEWARVVVDEYPYMLPNACSTMNNLKKRNLWLVSATPNLNNFEEVRKVATYFKVNLGIKDYTQMETDILKKALTAMTTSEQFLAFESRKSAAWYEHRTGKAQEFLNLSAICDEPSYNQIKYSEIIKVSQAPAAQLAAAKELMHALAVTKNGSLPRKRFGNSNQDLQFAAAFANTKTAVQALINQAGFFNNYTDPALRLFNKTNVATSAAVNVTVQRRTDSLANEKLKFMDRLPQIFWLLNHKEAGNSVEKWQAFLATLRCLGDQGLSTELQSYVSDAVANRNNSAAFAQQMTLAFPDDSIATVCGLQQSAVQARLRNDVGELTNILDELLKQHRGLQFMQSVEICQRQSHFPTSIACNSCGESFALQDVKVLTGCGHIICNGCLNASLVCPVQGCKSGCESYQMSSGSMFATPETAVSGISECGQKAEDMLHLILDLPENEKALLFVQSEATILDVENLFDAHHIPFLTLSDKKLNADGILIDFQKNKGNPKVLILNINEAAAAGCNLTRANHVIFFGPYMTTGSHGQSKYDATMEQAMGRAIRYGQTKFVKIYHLMTAYTVDVDIFEHRKQKIVTKDENEFKARDRQGSELSGELASCVSHLVHAPRGVHS